MHLYRNAQNPLGLGDVLDGKYCLISELSAVDGQARFIAEDLVNNREVELVILSGVDGAPCCPPLSSTVNVAVYIPGSS